MTTYFKLHWIPLNSSDLRKLTKKDKNILGAVRHENKNLADDIDHIGEDSRNIHETEKALKAEELELQAILEEAKVALEQKYSKTMYSESNWICLNYVTKSTGQEKGEEFDNTTNMPSTLCKPISKPKSRVRLRPSAWRRSWKLTSTNSKSLLIFNYVGAT